MDTKAERMIKTTEFAIRRGLALGLNAVDPIFRDTARYVSRLLEESIDFPDPPEQNDLWRTGVQLFVAATLAQIQPNLQILDGVWDLWANIAYCTFASGAYDPDDEIRAHCELTGASVNNSYLVLNNQYTLSLLGSRATQLRNDTEKALVAWIWHKEDGVGYLEVSLSNPPGHSSSGALDRWFTSLELISCFPSWCGFARGVINWLWAQRNQEGFWDFGLDQACHLISHCQKAGGKSRIDSTTTQREFLYCSENITIPSTNERSTNILLECARRF